MISIESEEKLKELGDRLRAARLGRNEPQKEFAIRLGVSVPTLRKMEKGDPSVSVGLWIEALDLFDRLLDLDQVMAPEHSLFEQYENLQKKTRKRASKRKGV